MKYCVLPILLILTSLTLKANTVAWSLVDDWSDTSNPNAPWTYRAGDKILPSFTWYAGVAAPQPSWGDPFSPNQPSRLPAWFKSQSDGVGGSDWKKGDVVVHTQDDLNGNGNGQANVLWTSPVDGIVDVAGNVWLGAHFDRSDEWRLFLNGILLSSGMIYPGDSYTRVNPFEFNTGSGGANALNNLSVHAGDTIELELARTSTYGYFVGVNEAITLHPAPELVGSKSLMPIALCSLVFFALLTRHGVWRFNRG